MTGSKRIGRRSRRLLPEVLVAALAIGLAVMLVPLVRPTGGPGPAALERGDREREILALRGYAARAERGSLVPRTDAVIAIRQEFLQSVIDRSLPFRRYFENERYVARLDHAIVRLEPGVARVTLSGRGALTGQEDSPLYADLTVRGVVTIDGVDPDRGALRARIVITGVATQRARPRDLQTLLNPVARYFGRLKAHDWNRRDQSVALPIRVDHEIVLPAIDGQVTIPESRVPLSFAVTEVTTFDGRMAVSLALLPDSSQTGALGAAARDSGAVAAVVADTVPTARPNSDRRVRAVAPVKRPAVPPRPPPASPRAAWFGRGRGAPPAWTEAKQLEIAVARLARGDSLWRSMVATDHDVVVIVPEAMLDALVSRASFRYLHGVAIDIHSKRAIPLDVGIKVKMLGAKIGVGRIEGVMHIGRITGRLTLDGDPRVTLDPPHDISIEMPAQVLAGRGSIDMDVAWNPALLTGVVCRGFHFHERLEGEILPFRNLLTTSIRYSIQDSFVVGRPRVRRDKFRLATDLTEASWTRLRDALIAEDRFSHCGLVMDADSVLGKLRRLADRGVKIRLPARMFKPFRLPVMIDEHYASSGYRIETRMFDPDVVVRPDHLRIAFRARLRVIPPSDRAAATRLLGPRDDHAGGPSAGAREDLEAR